MVLWEDEVREVQQETTGRSAEQVQQEVQVQQV